MFEFGDAVLRVETLWRISVEGRLRRTSADDGQTFGLGSPVDAHADARNLLVGREITALKADLDRADLVFHFGLTHVLEIVTDSSYEAWQLTAPGRNYVAAAGGRVQELRA